MRLSKNFTLDEMEASDTADNYGIDNTLVMIFMIGRQTCRSRLILLG